MKRFLSIILTVLLVVSVIPTGLFGVLVKAETATSGTTGDCTWSLDGTVLTISGKGAMGDYSSSSNIHFGNTTSNIPWGTSITEVIINAGVTEIGEYAFYKCKNLTNITIPDGVKHIGSYAFYGCSSLESVTIPDSVISMDMDAFYMCENLTDVFITDIKAWCEIDFNDYLTANPFYHGKNLYLNGELITNLEIPRGVYSIRSCAFGGCESITSVIIPEGVTYIGSQAFDGCINISSVTIPVSVTHIYMFAFCNLEIKDVWYSGNETDRDNIVLDTGNSLLSKAKWHYNTCAYSHIYNGDCDDSCNVCEWVREPSKNHSFDNNCDTKCNVCAFTRTIKHAYEWVIDEDATCATNGKKHEECSVCHIKRNENTIIGATGNHTYDDDCDEVCNICSFVREVPHFFEWIIDKENNCGVDGYKHEECTVCHTKRNESTVIYATGDHKYDNDCDELCNVCSLVRVDAHFFEWIIDKENNCGVDGTKHEECFACLAVRNENTIIKANGNHRYDNGCDKICNICEGVRETEHVYSGTNDLSCNECFESLTPTAPTIYETMADYIVLNEMEGCEYSIDGINWQDSATFNNLIPGTEHKFYQRVKETSSSKQSAVSVALTVETLQGYYVYFDYNMGDGRTEMLIKTHNIILDLEQIVPSAKGYKFLGWATAPNSSYLYTSYSRNMDTTFYAKWEQNCLDCSGTGKIKHVSYTTVNCGYCGGDGKITNIGSTFKCKSCGSNYILTENVPTSTGGYGTRRYCGLCGSENLTRDDTVSNCGSCSGSGYKWQENISYSQCDTCEGEGTQICPQPKAPKPQAKTIGEDYIELVEVSGAQYSIDGINWQNDPVFRNIERGIVYNIYQRYAASSINTAGEASEPLIIELHTHTYDNACDTECNLCHETRIITHIYSGNCDTECNICGCTRSSDVSHSYSEASDMTCNICEFERTLEGISLTNIPNKLIYLECKERLNVSGGKIILCYDDGTFEIIDITENMIDDFDNTKVGPQTLTVTYKGKIATYDIEIISKELVSIELIDNGLKKEYLEGKEDFDVTGGKVRLYYNNDTFADIDLNVDMISGFDNTVVGIQTLTVTYMGKAVNFEIEIVKDYTPGDIDGILGVTDADAVYLLYHTFLSDIYPVNQDCDFNGDGEVNDKDAVYLLYHTFLPDLYPID